MTRSIGLWLSGLLLLLGLGAPATAGAATAFPFAIFIEQALNFTALMAPDGTSVSHSADRPIYALVNGQKGADRSARRRSPCGPARCPIPSSRPSARSSASASSDFPTR